MVTNRLNLLRKFAICCGCLTLILLGSQVTQAQRGGFGRGGFGRGPGGGFSGGVVLELLGMDKVREELAVSEEQQTVIEEATAMVRDAMPDVRSKIREMMSGGERPDRETMSKKMREIMEEAKEPMEKAQAAMRETLVDTLDPDQYDRLIGLLIQRAGDAAAFTVPMVKDSLNVTDEQAEAFNEKRSEMSDKMREEMESYQEEMQAARENRDREKMQDLRRELGEKQKELMDEIVSEVLTEEQQSQIESLRGEEFEFPQRRLRRGGNGRGGEGGRRGEGRRRGRDRGDRDA